MSPNTDPWKNPEHWRDDMNTQDREFWKQHNRRKHQHWQSYREEQREAFREAAAKPEPEVKPLTRVLEIKR